VISFIRFFDAPNYVKSEVLESIKKVAVDESSDNSAEERGEASLQLCWAHIDGFGTPQDIHGALAWAERAAKLGSISAGGLIKRIFDSAGKAMDLDLQQKCTEWQFKAVRSGLSITREELRQVDSDQCASAEEPFRITLGAEMVDRAVSSDILHFDRVNMLFHPTNRDAMHQCHLQAGRYEGIPFLSFKKNTFLHAGAAMGVDIQHFDSYIKEFHYQKYINAKDVAGNTPLHVAFRCNHPEHAKCLLKHGADATVINNRGESPSHWLVYVDDSGEQQDLVNLLVGNGARFDVVAKPPSLFRDPYSFIRHGGTPLHWAVERNLVEMTNTLLEHDADPEFIYNGSTPIDLAVERSNPEVLRALLSKAKQPPVSVRVCTDPNASESAKFVTVESYVNFAITSLLLHDRWLFHGRAWLQCLRETIHVLRDFRLNPVTKHSPMQVAALASTGSTEILELLVEEGFDDHIEGKASFWQDLLHECIRTSQPFVLLFLFEHYMKHSSLEELSRPERLLLASAESMNCDSSVVDKILETAVDINCLAGKDLGKSPLVLAVGSRNYELATFLLSRGADINVRYFGGGDDKVSTNILYELIVSNRDIELGPLKYLLEPLHPYVDKLPDFLVIPEQLGTAHHLACRTGNLAIVEFLLKKFPNKDQIDFSDFSGWTALHYATFNGHLEVVKMLCKAGVDVNVQAGARNIPRRERKTVLDLCFSWSAPSKDTLEANHGRQMTKEDVYLNRLHIADHLQDFNARRANRKLISRPQPLRFAFLAVITGSVKLLSEALRRLDMVSIRQPILDALLFNACRRESTAVVQHLISAGADLNVRSKKFNTPLHIATILKQPLVVHLLLQRGAEVNPVNECDDTPLSYALQNKQPAAIRALKGAGGTIPIPRAIFNKIFTDMGVEPPNLSGSELPTFTFRLEGEPSDGDEDEDGEADKTGDAAQTGEDQGDSTELGPESDKEEEGWQDGGDGESAENVEGDGSPEGWEDENEQDESCEDDNESEDGESDENVEGDENLEGWEDENEDDDESEDNEENEDGDESEDNEESEDGDENAAEDATKKQGDGHEGDSLTGGHSSEGEESLLNADMVLTLALGACPRRG
jgi:ankyrin repeat protein